MDFEEQLRALETLAEELLDLLHQLERRVAAAEQSLSQGWRA